MRAPFECGTLSDAPSSAKNGEAQMAGTGRKHTFGA
jgi:hypothetical protein